MTSGTSGRPSGGRFGLSHLLLVMTLAAIWFLSLRAAVDPDYGWHVANGRLVLAGDAFSGSDVYSWTATGYWIVHEWLTEAAMSIVHSGAGASGNSVLFAFVTMLAFLLVALRLRRRGTGSAATLITLVIAFLCSMMSVGVRPQMLELAYMAALLLMVDRWIDGDLTTRKFLASIAAGSLVWTNTHGSFPLLIVLLGVISAGLLVERDNRWRIAACASAVAAAAALINPWGWKIYSFAFQSVNSEPTLTLIQEWRRPDLLTGSLAPFDLAVVMAAVAFVAAALRRFRNGSNPATEISVRLDEVAVAAALLYLAVSSGRHVMLFGVGAAPLIAWTADWTVARVRGAGKRSAERTDVDARGKDVVNLIAALAVVAALALSGWNVVSPSAQATALAKRYPVNLVADVERLNRTPQRLLNEYAWGGFLIERGLTPVFIDGRSELYGDPQLLRYSAISRLEPGWHERLDSIGVTLALVPTASMLDSGLVARGWHEVRRDDVGVLLQRR